MSIIVDVEIIDGFKVATFRSITKVIIKFSKIIVHDVIIQVYNANVISIDIGIDVNGERKCVATVEPNNEFSLPIDAER